MSCSSSDDDGDNNQGETQETLLLKKVFKDGVLIREYEYYADNKLKSQVGLLVEDQILEVRYEYVADTIVESYYNLGETTSFAIYKSYEINNTTSKRDYYNNENLTLYKIYTFDNNQCGAILYETFNSSGSLIDAISFSYTDENCSTNSIHEGFGYSNDSSLNDNKKASYESINSPINRQEILHNILEYRIWDNDDQLINSRSSNSEFVYNSDDYPTKETRTYLDGSSLIYTFEYY